MKWFFSIRVAVVMASLHSNGNPKEDSSPFSFCLLCYSSYFPVVVPWLRQLIEGRIYLHSWVHCCGERHGSKPQAWWPGQEAESSHLQWRYKAETELGKDCNHTKLAPSKAPSLNPSTSSPKQPYQLGTQYSNTRVDGRHSHLNHHVGLYSPSQNGQHRSMV